MKKYNLTKIMKRAWEIKKEADRKTLNNNYNRNIFELKEEQKAIFGECLKMAWEETKKAEYYAEKYDISVAAAAVMIEKETSLDEEKVTWTIWSNYGKKRAYYKVSGWSKYQNSKSDNYVNIV